MLRLHPKAFPRSFYQLCRSEQIAVLDLADRHKSLLWTYGVELATSPVSRHQQIADECCIRMGITREQFDWTLQATRVLAFGVELGWPATAHQNGLHRAK